MHCREPCVSNGKKGPNLVWMMSKENYSTARMQKSHLACKFPGCSSPLLLFVFGALKESPCFSFFSVLQCWIILFCWTLLGISECDQCRYVFPYCRHMGCVSWKRDCSADSCWPNQFWVLESKYFHFVKFTVVLCSVVYFKPGTNKKELSMTQEKFE